LRQIMARGLRKQLMHLGRTLMLVAAAGWIGVAAPSQAQTAHGSLGVSATVTRSCALSNGGTAQVQINCLGGTSWTRSAPGDGRAAGQAYAAKSLQAAPSSDLASPKILFVTISF
jgi:hypothetical protein